MRSSHTDALLTGAALTGRCLAWGPLWVLMLASFCGRGLLPGCGILTVLSCAAAVTARCSYRLRKRSSGFRLRGFTLLLTGSAAVTLLHLVTGRWVVPVLLGTLTQCAAVSGTDKKPPELFHVTAFAFSVTGAAVSVLLLRLAMLPVPGTLLLVFTAVISALFFLLRNQFMLTRMVNRRSRTETAVPAEIRRGNLVMFCGVLAVIFLLLLLHAPLLRLLRGAVHLLVLLVRTLGRGLVRLISRLGGAPPETDAEGGGVPGIPEAETANAGSSPLFALLWIPLIAVTVYICYFFLTDWVYAIREFFVNLLQKLRSGEAPAKTFGHSEYTDTETAAQPEPGIRLRRRRWRRSYRAWKRLPEGDAKFYAGYQLLLTAPAWAQGAVRGADTVQEIRDKWAKDYLPEELLNAVTADFHADKYECAGLPAHAADDLRKALEALV
ncbi:MAG: hypothetical protein IKQ39_08125 [Oscillospiraceae bacterium]|nr:hypothetical protein [Oscillospiraceae bacterium]